MDFKTSVITVLTQKYGDFSGRASLTEFSWFALFSIGANAAAWGIFGAIGGLVTLGLIIPSLAVTVRRFHDRGMTGWWCLAAIVPVVLLILCMMEGEEGANKYGAPPTG